MHSIAMSLKLLAVLFLQVEMAVVANEDYNTNFIYNNGFQSSNLTLDGIAGITTNGLLKLTNDTKQEKGHAFYPYSVTFKNTTSGFNNEEVFSFSTTFVFAIRSQYSALSGHGIVFVIAPQRGLPNSLPSQYLGLFNKTNNGNATNHVFGVELDTILSTEFFDINDNHVGIDINDLKSAQSQPAGYYSNSGFKNLSLISGYPMQVWVEYDGVKKQIDVTLAPTNVEKPQKPLLSLTKDLSPILNNTMYVGFSSSTGSVLTSHYVLGWSFKINGQAQPLLISQLPKLPRLGERKESKALTIGVPMISLTVVFVVILAVIYFIRRKKKFSELVEDWEMEYGPHRFKYKDLYFATKGFKEKELLGSGGFGRVYKGVMPASKVEVAVKRVSHESRQGMREFVAEIVSIGRLRHRNLVPLLGYCRRKGELLLVYDYMPKGSLDKYLYNQPRVTLNWNQRFIIIKGVASGLFYLHEEWEQVVVHRDIKASNVLLDAELNGRLGDFGLARLYDHGSDPQTTHVVGTLGYLAPENTRTGKATTMSDVYAFGAFLLEVACGRRPIELVDESENSILVDWVYSCWKNGEILEAKDPNFGTDYRAEEVELVLKLGLLCSHSEPMARPSMRQVVQYLEGDFPLPDLHLLSLSSTGLTFGHYVEDFQEFQLSYPSSSTSKAFSRDTTTTTTSVAASLLSGGR
ncbi:hypothetical protein HN51_066401 [Arachis hypogaea]|uniref:non-specific serine/threonine protein kinase n=1 Tax=Arachis hypogaea TaxID=3818 RepID=A0A444ZNH6_ARAHY|nr:L-type lectin-domain containing receptor kinase IV.1 [Arachis ipaensis]XP_025648569.1 L-type lectin-domain containing receptor kinase IV.1 [Arachis hypogaea]QHO07583.1 L-type lectin-domain containing receptor kinase IV [Arachis hypogaea]RYR15759.1 hypothetical protein Ahy_B04g072686 [Arachis hypogaea]